MNALALRAASAENWLPLSATCARQRARTKSLKPAGMFAADKNQDSYFRNTHKSHKYEEKT
jgi:hypothetical protein